MILGDAIIAGAAVVLVAALALIARAHRKIAHYAKGAGERWFLHGFVGAVGAAVGTVTVIIAFSVPQLDLFLNAQHIDGRAAVLLLKAATFAFATALVHVPPTVVLFIKHRRGEV